MTEVDTSKEAVELLAAVLVGRAPQNSKHDQNRAADALLALLSERDALRKAVDSYSYIGRDGKMVLAKDLEDERDALRSQLQAARDEALEDAAYQAQHACLVPPDGGSPTEEEIAVCDEAAKRIRALKSTSAEREG